MSKFVLPEKVVEQHILIFGKTGAGKSTAMRDIAEHLLEEKKPICIIDPKGDWWGLKSSKDGKHAGFSVVIFGGPHADVPINDRAGAVIAELAARGNRPCIIDLSEWMPGQVARFMTDFLPVFFKMCEGLRWLAFDEVHNFIPQGKAFSPDEGKQIYWMNRIASEGRGRGIRIIAASQRPQKVHKNFVTQAETLIALRVIHTLDRDAVKEWLDGAGDPAKAKDVLRELAELPRGEAWVWSPEIQFGPERVKFPMFSTYDSFAPQASHAPPKLTGWADVDLDAVSSKLESIVKEAEANDPEKLRVEIRRLNAELKNKAPRQGEPASSKPDAAMLRRVSELSKLLEEAMRVFINVTAYGFDSTPVTQDDVRNALEATSKEIAAMVKRRVENKSREFDVLKKQAESVLRRMELALRDDEKVLVNVRVHKNEPFTVAGGKTNGAGTARADYAPPRAPLPAPSRQHENGRARMPIAANSADGGALTGPERRILRALAELRSIGKETVPKAMCAAWSAYSPIGGAFGNPVGKLRTAGLIDYPAPSTVCLTEAGIEAAGPVEYPDAAEIRRRIEGICTGPEQKILAVLLDNGDAEMSKDELAERSGYSPIGGAFGNPVGALRTKGLLDYPRPGVVRPSDWLFTEA